MRQEDQDSSSQNGRSPASVIATTGTVGGTEDGERKATAAGKAVRWRRRSAGARAFLLDNLIVKRETLKKQVNDPDFEAIREVVSGELKAVDQIIQEYIQAFELYDTRPSQDTP